MRERPSFTASWVAAARSLGAELPLDARLADDPYGARFADAATTVAMRAALALGPLTPFVLYMQLRTRAIDDELRAFTKAGGRQVVILGAGYDCRAARFRSEISGGTVFEVDHPSTQRMKKDVLAATPTARVEYLAWNFETDPLARLPEALAARGHDAALPTLTIWEGVTMYLSEPAVDAAVRAVRALSARGSPFVLSYFDKVLIDRPRPFQQLIGAVVKQAGEPFTFGWEPSYLPSWLAGRDFALATDRSAVDLGTVLLPPELASRLDSLAEHRHIAVARAS